MLAKYVQGAGSSRIVVTLHPIAGKSKTPSTVLEVHLDGQRIGQLTPAMSATLMPVINEARSNDRSTAAWAILSGSRLAAEVVLKAMRPDEVPNTWPSSSNVLLQLGSGAQSIPTAYNEQVQLTPPPLPSGLGAGIWIAAAIVAIALVAGTSWWSLAKKRLAPKRALDSPL